MILLAKLEYWVPLLHTLRTYRAEWLRNDLAAGVSVAAIQIPTAIAYAELAGFGPEVGLYASILPLVAYALFGSSRQLIVGPDAATCAIVAAVLVPLAAGDPGKYAVFSAILGLLVGGLCIMGGMMRLGFLADFLSRPVLTGLLNGIALSIIVGQLGKVLGFSAEAHRFSLIILEFASRLRETHLPTLALGGGILALILLLGKKAPRVPGPLAGIVLGALAVYLLNLGAYDLKLVGSVPAGLPSLSLPAASLDEIEALLSAALGIAVVSFCSAVLTARIFAVKNHYVIDANRDLVALGAANVMTGLSHGFVISGADSRTAVNDLVGGKTQITSLVAAACTALVLLFLTAPLAFVPVAALGAVLLTAGFKLLDLQSLRKVYFLSRFEFWHSILTTVAVIALGIVPGILLAISLAIAKLLQAASRPNEAIIGRVPGLDGYNEITGQAGAETIPGLLVYRFDGPPLFFNADYLKSRVRARVEAASPDLRWFLYVAEPANYLDVTGAEALESLRAELAERGITFAIARPHGRFLSMLKRSGLADRIGSNHLFPSIRSAVQAFLDSSPVATATAPIPNPSNNS